MLRTFDIVLVGVMVAAAVVTYSIKHKADLKLEEVADGFRVTLASGAALTAAGRATDGLAAQFDGDLAELVSQAERNRRRLYEFATAPGEADVAEVIRLRLDAANAAVGATRLESALAGGQGYRAGTAANRRFREAAFLPVQSPSEGQLRWELKQYG